MLHIMLDIVAINVAHYVGHRGHMAASLFISFTGTKVLRGWKRANCLKPAEEHGLRRRSLEITRSGVYLIYAQVRHYTVSQKKTSHFNFRHNFAICRDIFFTIFEARCSGLIAG